MHRLVVALLVVVGIVALATAQTEIDLTDTLIDQRVALTDAAFVDHTLPEALAHLREMGFQSIAIHHGGPTRTNHTLTGRELDRLAALDEAGAHLLQQAICELGLSARAYDKVRSMARTIADLENVQDVHAHHVAEAIGYRLLDRKR